jgi:pimeloyl-ACP methyl ester carboxylesterase
MPQRDCVLVHGAWHGGWHWEDIVPRLHAAGLRAHAPTLTGLAERAGEATPETGIAAHVEDVVRVIEQEDLRDVTLVGHSYGGMIVTGVASRCQERLKTVVYLDAFVPRDGQSAGDLLGEEFVAGAHAAAEAAGTPSLLPPLFTVEQATGWTGARAEAHAARLTPQPIATMTDTVVAPKRWSAERLFVYCNALPLGIVETHAEAARASDEWRYAEMPCPHDAVRTMPAAVAGLIESIAREG